MRISQRKWPDSSPFKHRDKVMERCPLYRRGKLPGPEGDCIFLRSPTPVKNQRTSEACKKCRERKAKVLIDAPRLGIQRLTLSASALASTRRVVAAQLADSPASTLPRSMRTSLFRMSASASASRLSHLLPPLRPRRKFWRRVPRLYLQWPPFLSRTRVAMWSSTRNPSRRIAKARSLLPTGIRPGSRMQTRSGQACIRLRMGSEMPIPSAPCMDCRFTTATAFPLPRPPSMLHNLYVALLWEVWRCQQMLARTARFHLLERTSRALSCPVQ